MMTFRSIVSGLLIAVTLLWPFKSAFSCGFCLEDKIATVYDHAFITDALSRGKHIAYVEILGNPSPETISRALATAHISKEQLRLSTESGALSFEFHPFSQDLTRLLSDVNEELSSSGASLRLLRLMTRPGDLSPTPDKE